MPSSINHTTQQLCRWHSYSSVAELEQAALQAILKAAQHAIHSHGAFRIVLAGGSTPRRIYELLRKSDTDWAAWQVYFGDERCLPPDHSERNSRMAALAWLDHVPIPSAHIHVIPAEIGAEAAANTYNEELRSVDKFDLVLLGLGEDGHTASLFPGHDFGTANDDTAALPVHHAPKPPPDRVSLNAQRLSAANQVIFIVTGESKRLAVRDWRNGVTIPAATIIPPGGVDVFLEASLL